MRAIIATLLALFLASCAEPGDLKLINGTGDQIHDLSVGDGKTTWKLGDLNPGQSVMFTQPLAGEGGPTISWAWRGKRYSKSGCYYTGGMPARGSITIVGDHLTFRCE